MAEIKISWEEYQELANKAIKEKYPNVDISKSRFYKDYAYEGEGGFYDSPTGVYFEIEK